MQEEKKTVAAIWQAMEGERADYLEKARRASELTLPYLYGGHRMGGRGARTLTQPYNSFVVSGLQCLVNKLMSALVPSNAPFFRMAVDPMKLEEFRDQNPELFSEIELALTKYEKAIKAEMEETNLRQAISEAFYHLLVAGNALLCVPKNGNLRTFGLEKYGIRRDPCGHPIELAIKECVSVDALDPELYAKVHEEDKEEVELYTYAKLVEGKWHTWQEVGGEEVDGTYGEYQPEKLPYMPLRYITVDGEHYGRGLVECYIGDIRTLNGLSQAIQEGAFLASRTHPIIDPSANMPVEELATLRNGEAILGRPDQFGSLQMGKMQDFQTVHAVIGEILERLKAVFLLPDVRKAERVTAEEIRLVAQHLEQALGSVYAVLAQELQLPLVRAFINRLSASNRLPKLPTDLVKPLIITGLEAMGRVSDLERLDLFLGGSVQLLGPEVVRYINTGDYLKRRGAALGIDGFLSLIKTPEEVEQQDALNAQRELLAKATPNAVQAAGNLISQQQDNHGRE